MAHSLAQRRSIPDLPAEEGDCGRVLFLTFYSSKDAQISIKYTYDFTKWFAQNYSKSIPELPGAFDETFIPKLGEKQRQLKDIS